MFQVNGLLRGGSNGRPPPRGWLAYGSRVGAGRVGHAGHAVNPSMGARCSHPCEQTVLHDPPARRPDRFPGAASRGKKKKEKAVAPTHGRRKPSTPFTQTYADHGSALPMPACPGHHGPVEGGAGWVGGGVERHGWRETRPAGAAFAVPRRPTPPRHHAALQLWTLTLTLLQKRAAGPQARQPHPITSCRHPARDGPPHGAASAGSATPPAPRTPSPHRCTAWARARPGHPGSAPRRSAG